MKNLLKIILCFLIMSIAACTKSPEQVRDSMLSEISGVWKEPKDTILVTLHYSDKKFRVYIDDREIGATVGEVDDQNRTVNLNVEQKDGAKGIWTIKQIRNAEKASFTLLITTHNGAQGEFEFIRKVSKDDVERFDTAEMKRMQEHLRNADAIKAAEEMQARRDKISQQLKNMSGLYQGKLGTLQARDAGYSSLYFRLDLAQDQESGAISGEAEFNGTTATYSEADCNITFTPNGESIKIIQTGSCKMPPAISASGEYTKAK